MTAIERAEALLAAADLSEPECGCLPRHHRYRGLHESDCPWLAWREARFVAGKRLVADAVDTLRGYIGAVKAMEKMERRVGVVSGEGIREALADFERLFPEEP